MKESSSTLSLLLMLLVHITNVSSTEWYPNRIPTTIIHLKTLNPKMEHPNVDGGQGRTNLEVELTTDSAKGTEVEVNTVLNPAVTNDNGGVNNGNSPMPISHEESLVDTTSAMPPEEAEPTVLGPLEKTSTSPPSEATNPGEAANPEPEKIDFRLPGTIRPLRYTVKLQPFINGNLSIHGYMEVEIEVLTNTSEITLHAADIALLFHTIRLTSKDDSAVPKIVNIVIYRDREFITAVLDEPVIAGKTYTYSMFYYARLADRPEGFFHAAYSESDGEEKRLAATIFQPTNARRAFPCFDEPAMKATFDIHLAREANMTAVSNMPLLKTVPLEGSDGGWVVDQFETTPPMSTYLVIFVISHLEYVSTTASHGNTPVRVWARGEVLQRANFTLHLAPEILTFFENQFNVPYPLPKLDIVALPSPFTMAFEGWGAILNYAEESALFSPNTSISSHKHQVAMILAHEMAHQWFGNLVTPVWWTDLWLNEGFASYMENVAVAKIRPEWDIEEHQVMQDLHAVLRMDGQLSSHPINIPVYHPDEIYRIFDRISYEKGSSIIRMMNYILTEETFKKGVTNFLRENKFASATQDDLWESLTMAGYEDGTLPRHLSIKTIMDGWTLQMGYPVVIITRNADGNIASVSQERFLLERNITASERAYRWWVPLTYTTQAHPNFTNTQSPIWMRNSSSHTVITDLPRRDQWIIFNLRQTGYYRVDYDDHNWDLLIRQLQGDHKAIDVINRAQLIDDALNLALAGRLSYDKALSMTLYLQKETELSVWDAALGNIGYMNEMLANTEVYGGFQKYILSLLVPLYEQLGFQSQQNEPFVYQMKRPDFLKWACEFGHVSCVRKARDLYKQWMLDDQTNSIEPSTLRSIYCTAIAYGGIEEWDFAWQQYKRTDEDKQKDRIIKALSCNNEDWIRARFLDMAFTENNGMRSHDTFQIFESVASRSNGNSTAWHFLRKNWTKVPRFYGRNYDTIRDFITLATKRFNTEEDLIELKAFKKEHESDPMVRKATDEAIKLTNRNIDWMDRNYGVIRRWLAELGVTPSP